MTPIPVRTEGADRVVGHLYGPGDIDALAEDMLNVKVGEYGIDVGWYPEADPCGQYVVRVYRGRFSNLVRRPLTTGDPLAVKAYVEREVAYRARPIARSVEGASVIELVNRGVARFAPKPDPDYSTVQLRGTTGGSGLSRGSIRRWMSVTATTTPPQPTHTLCSR